MKRQVGIDVLYTLTDFLFANSTEAERNTILRETARGRKQDKNLTDNDGKLYYGKKFSKKIFKKIQKML